MSYWFWLEWIVLYVGACTLFAIAPALGYACLAIFVCDVFFNAYLRSQVA